MYVWPYVRRTQCAWSFEWFTTSTVTVPGRMQAKTKKPNPLKANARGDTNIWTRCQIHGHKRHLLSIDGVVSYHNALQTLSGCGRQSTPWFWASTGNTTLHVNVSSWIIHDRYHHFAFAKERKNTHKNSTARFLRSNVEPYSNHCSTERITKAKHSQWCNG